MTKFLIVKKLNSSKMNNMNILFYFILILSTTIVINSSSWFNAWMGMEINLMSFIPLMSMKKIKKTSNSMMMYFIIQAGASSLLFMTIIMMKMQMIFFKINFMMSCLQLSLLMKLGASPFHWWMPKILKNLNWMNCFILLTWQKIAPMILMMSTNNNYLIYISSLLSTFMGAILGMNQNSIKLIMAYSSINHLGWLLITMILNMNLLFIYFFIYSITNLMICMLMNNLNYNFLNQLYKNNNQNMNNKLIMMSLFFSLAGLPPFIGFMPKLLTLIMMMKNNLIMESMLFIIMATISLSFYINPILSITIMMKFNSKWNFKIFQINKIMMSILIMNLLLIMMIFTPMLNNNL
uniref:NADH-ubiquinone oxidoreductase chain 2 n=1 Tax=Taxoblenus sp. TaxID=2821556 RepID=A0A8A6C446_9HYME|nr:NADH dehydrogenase subunit 2 [Taxoblenus sinicus]